MRTIKQLLEALGVAPTPERQKLVNSFMQRRNVKYAPLYLSPAQMRVYKFIDEYINKNHMAPTLKEMSKGMNRALSCIWEHLDAMEKKGYIKRERNSARSIRLLYATGTETTQT